GHDDADPAVVVGGRGQGLLDGVGDLGVGNRQLEGDALGAATEPIEVSAELDDPAPGGPQGLVDAVTVEEAPVEHADGRVLGISGLAVVGQPDLGAHAPVIAPGTLECAAPPSSCVSAREPSSNKSD